MYRYDFFDNLDEELEDLLLGTTIGAINQLIDGYANISINMDNDTLPLPPTTPIELIGMSNDKFKLLLKQNEFRLQNHFGANKVHNIWNDRRLIIEAYNKDTTFARSINAVKTECFEAAVSSTRN